jgi:hypothetical protein
MNTCDTFVSCSGSAAIWCVARPPDSSAAPREEVEAVRGHAVASRVGDQARAERRAIGGQSGCLERATKRIVELVV